MKYLLYILSEQSEIFLFGVSGLNVRISLLAKLTNLLADIKKPRISRFFYFWLVSQLRNWRASLLFSKSTR